MTTVRVAVDIAVTSCEGSEDLVCGAFMNVLQVDSTQDRPLYLRYQQVSGGGHGQRCVHMVQWEVIYGSGNSISTMPAGRKHAPGQVNSVYIFPACHSVPCAQTNQPDRLMWRWVVRVCLTLASNFDAFCCDAGGKYCLRGCHNDRVTLPRRTVL